MTYALHTTVSQPYAAVLDQVRTALS